MSSVNFLLLKNEFTKVAVTVCFFMLLGCKKKCCVLCVINIADEPLGQSKKEFVFSRRFSNSPPAPSLCQWTLCIKRKRGGAKHKLNFSRDNFPLTKGEMAKPKGDFFSLLYLDKSIARYYFSCTCSWRTYPEDDEEADDEKTTVCRVFPDSNYSSKLCC